MGSKGSVPPKFTPPVSARLSPAEMAIHLRQLYLTVNQHDQAITLVNDRIPTTASAAVTAAAAATAVAGVSSFNAEKGDISYFPNLGQVNNRTGQTAYTVQSNDAGRMILLSNAAPVAVTLDSSTVIPWYAVILNQGAGAATLTPTTGQINGGASLALPGGGFTIVYFDGANWYASGGSGVTVHNAYTAVTTTYAILTTDYQIECTSGTFTATLPTAAGITGQAFSIKNSGTGVITVATTSSQTIDGSLTQALTQYDNLMVMSNGANYIII